MPPNIILFLWCMFYVIVVVLVCLVSMFLIRLTGVLEPKNTRIRRKRKACNCKHCRDMRETAAQFKVDPYDRKEES